MALTDLQVENRRSGFGGSDAPAACGLSKWKSPLTLYLEKRGEIEPQPESPLMEWGNRLEPVIRQKYADETGRVVRLPEDTLRHATLPFMLAHPDGVTDDGRLFEAKNTRSDSEWGEPCTDQVPPMYLVQVQHNMLVAGLEVADIAVLFSGSDFRIYEVRADRELQAMIVANERALWSHVERGVPPPPTTAMDIERLYGRGSTTGCVQASQEVVAACETLAGLRAHAKTIAEEIELAETTVKVALGPADTLLHGGKVLATWRASKPVETIDVAALRAAHPDIAAAFTRAGNPRRPLLLKAGSR